MKIGVFSDTHDYLEKIEKAFKFFQKEKVDLIIHCGDWVSPFVPQFIYNLEPKLIIPIKSVFGNNEGDHFRFLERKKKEGWNIEFYRDAFEFETDGKKIIVYHGSSKLITASLIESKNYNAVFTGHTHQVVNKTIAGILHLNPGTASGYCKGKITNNCTIALYDSQTNLAKIVKL